MDTMWVDYKLEWGWGGGGVRWVSEDPAGVVQVVVSALHRPEPPETTGSRQSAAFPPIATSTPGHGHDSLPVPVGEELTWVSI